MKKTVVMNQAEQDIKFMQAALEAAESARLVGEVPIGAVVVYQGEIIGSGYNLRETSNDPTTHAEIIAIREAALRLDSWRLLDCTLYVTLEPCVMCMGAAILARIPRLVFASRDPKAGAVGSIYNLASDRRFNHNIEVTEGVLAEKCSEMLSGFFKALREKKKAAKRTVPENE
jgi:tRNA(adenine34) deaminase